MSRASIWWFCAAFNALLAVLGWGIISGTLGYGIGGCLAGEMPLTAAFAFCWWRALDSCFPPNNIRRRLGLGE